MVVDFYVVDVDVDEVCVLYVCWGFGFEVDVYVEFGGYFGD